MPEPAVVNGEVCYYQRLHPWKYRLTRDAAITVDIHPADIILEPDPSDPRRKGQKVVPYLGLMPDGQLVMMRGYAWDGASGPTLDNQPPLANMIGASLVHDALYQLMRAGRIPLSHRDYADDLLRRYALGAGATELRADAWKMAVHFFGESGARPGPDPVNEELTAPMKLGGK